MPTEDNSTNVPLIKEIKMTVSQLMYKYRFFTLLQFFGNFV